MKRMHKKLLLLIFVSIFQINAETTLEPKALSYLAGDELDTVLEKELAQLGIEIQYQLKSVKNESKDWTVMVYIAADNDLRTFVRHNIKQMSLVGSNQYVNIVVQLNIKLQGNNKVTRLYLIKKDKVELLSETNQGGYMDSGDPETLISFFRSTIDQFPAENYALILWNHGTGVIDPGRGKIINPSILFNFNPKSQKLELDRSIGFLDLVELLYQDRGICWDNTTGNYLTNKKLDYALSEICKLNGDKKLSILGFDACLMSMLEIGSIAHNYADYMVGSQEVELGQGWNYTIALNQFNDASPTKTAFANQIVQAYEQSYHRITNDYTLSAVNLEFIEEIEATINHIGELILQAFPYQKNNSLRNTLLLCRNKKHCAHFDEPSYIDLHNFLSNLLQHINHIHLNSNEKLKSELHNALQQGMQLIEQAVIKNVAGRNQKGARGLSIYFPERRVHSSYVHSKFAKENAWARVIEETLKA